VFLFLFADSILISVMVDTICLGFLWILILGAWLGVWPSFPDASQMLPRCSSSQMLLFVVCIR
jgi:hypothetical protein